MYIHWIYFNCSDWCFLPFKAVEMSENNNKKKKKNSQMIIRINDEERAQFIALCDSLDTSAAREVRRFIREFIEEHNEK